MSAESAHRAGFVAIAGRPNAGKSTLLNALVGEKVAITAPQAQTTRTSIQGVLTEPGAQIAFVDTPGIHKPNTLFNKRMMETVRGAIEGRDLILYLADSTRPLGDEDRNAVSSLPKTGKVLLVMSKIDRLEDKRLLLPLIETYGQLFGFVEAIPISARKAEGLRELKRAIINQLPVSPALFPEDHWTDQPMRFLAAEMVRESILRVAREEVPHAAAVLVDSWEEKQQLTSIGATIYVERPGQKTILVGEKGQVLKQIGTAARLEVERLVGHKVFLSLFVKVKPRWREDTAFLDAIDSRAMVGAEDR